MVYRAADGLFYFKLLNGAGRILLESHGFATPKDAAQAIAALQQRGPQALKEISGKLLPSEASNSDAISAALQQLMEASV